ncbi:hypothetical protein C0Z18_08785 [Trinickia dabaoshanensis]|uniref:Uncharacterized protein n=1 Tax=Trinickia dabaoshanensis TaxID=564714 RepID=A0A2N7VVS7_9BURK|nr:hypothetical protein C0Z18_08785 [Trinickia dabaoshanensis]
MVLAGSVLGVSALIGPVGVPPGFVVGEEHVIAPVGVAFQYAVELSYQQCFMYPYAGSVGDAMPLTHATPFLNGPWMLSFWLGEVVPKTTFAEPSNEQVPCSDAHDV